MREAKIKHTLVEALVSIPALFGRGQAMGLAALLLSSASLLVTCGYGVFASFTHILGRSPSAISGATILALSLLVSVATAGCLLAMNRRSIELARLLDEIDETEGIMSEAKATATRIRAFRAKIAAHDTLS